VIGHPPFVRIPVLDRETPVQLENGESPVAVPI